MGSRENQVPPAGPRDVVVDFRVRLPNDERPRVITPPEYTSQYEAVLSVSERSGATMADLFSEMDNCEVTHAVIHAEYEFGDPVDELNDAVERAVLADSARLRGFGTISLDPLRVRRAMRQVDRVCAGGLMGLNLQPSFFGLPMTEPRLYPVYARAEELGLLVALHTGVNYTTHRIIENDHPRQLDQLACDFPDLVLIACHAGWPWVEELVAVMRKHPSVLADFGGLAPKYVGEPDTGWSVMRRFMNSLLSEQVLFATDWPVFPMRRALSEWRQMGLKAEVLASLLGGNALELFERSLPPRGDDQVERARDKEKSC